MQPEYAIGVDGEVLLPGPHGFDPIYARAVGWRRFHVGLDLGQAQDPSAVAIIQDECLPLPSYTPEGQQRLAPRQLTAVHTDRLPLMRYPALARHAAALMQQRPLSGMATLTVDATGVGRAFSDVLIEEGVAHTPVQMTAGSGVNRAGRYFNVGKLQLLSDLAAHLETGRLQIAGDLPMAEELRRELDSFQVGQTAAGNQVIEVVASGHHGDMVIALALALFKAAHGRAGAVAVTALDGMF